MKYSYKPKGVCAKGIEFDIEAGVLRKLHFTGGCPGNLIGIERLVEGMVVEEVISRLKGISCGKKSTSCPDQLVLALEAFQAGTLEEAKPAAPVFSMVG